MTDEESIAAFCQTMSNRIAELIVDVARERGMTLDEAACAKLDHGIRSAVMGFMGHLDDTCRTLAGGVLDLVANPPEAAGN